MFGWPTPQVDCASLSAAYFVANTTRPCNLIGGEAINFTAHPSLDYTSWCNYMYIYDGRLPGGTSDKLLCTYPNPSFDTDVVGWGEYNPYMYATGLVPSYQGPTWPYEL